METRRKKSWIALIISLLVIGALFLNQRLAEIDQKLNELQYLQHDLQQLNQSVHDVTYQVDQRHHEWTMEQMWVQEKMLDITAIDLANDTAHIKLDWSFKELDHDEEVTLLIREKDEHDWEEHLVELHKGLHFTSEQTISNDLNRS